MKKRTDENAVLKRVLSEGPDALLIRAEVTAIIAPRVMDKRDTRRTARNRIGTYLDRSLKSSEDVMAGGLVCRDDGRYTIDEVARWAQRRYPGVFDDLPTKSRNTDVHTTAIAHPTDFTLDQSMPGDSEERRKLIVQLRTDMERLKMEHVRETLERNRKRANTTKSKKGQ